LFLDFIVPLSGKTQNLPFISANTQNSESLVRPGNSQYYISLPDSFKISEARGKEGQLGYNIIPKDTSSTMFGFIQIRTSTIVGEGKYEDPRSRPLQNPYLPAKKLPGMSWKLKRDIILLSLPRKAT
jgi:hypothetical protein